MADRCLHRRLITTEDMVRHLDRLPNRPGNGQLRRLLAEVDGAAAASERVLHQLLRQAGVSGWQPNLIVELGAARYEVDVAFAQWKLAVEVDGWASHSGVDRFRADRRKQNALTLAGWTVVRFTWIDLVERPD